MDREIARLVVGKDILKEHTMGFSLFNYLKMKCPDFLLDSNFKSIEVVGDFSRKSGIMKKEKTDKLFNYKRPTYEKRGDTLIVKCFPSADYLLHYGLILATYLRINNKPIPKFDIEFSSKEEINKALDNTNIDKIPVFDYVILGYVERLTDDLNQKWKGEGDFLWKTAKIKGKSVGFVGCKFSYWGDIGGEVVRRLAKKGNKNIIYVGKLGSLNPEHIPNDHLATGDKSYLKGEIIEWNNIFKNVKRVYLKKGKHFSSPSILLETKDWAKKFSDYSFVDPEIGHMAKSCNEEGVNFGYLHIISNNLVKEFPEDLSNERNNSIVAKRDKLVIRLKKILSEGICRR